jgi:hypothetical protein
MWCGRMSRIKEMINALRKCAKEHENEVVCTGQIVTSSLCRDVADYLEADRWHYPSKGEYPTESGKYFCCHKYNDNLIPTIGIYNIHHKLWCGESGIAWNKDPIAWQQIVLPKEQDDVRD